MAKQKNAKSKPVPGLPTRQQIIDFITSSEQAAGKREIARAFGLSAQEKIALYRAISQESPQAMAAKIAGYKKEGYTKFQLKVGGDADADTQALLGITAQEPLLRIESIAYSANGRPVEHYRALHRCQWSRLHVKTTT